MEIVQKYITNNRYWNRRPIKVEALVLHSTGDAVPSAEAHYRYYNNPNVAASVHAFIDGNRDLCIQTAPWNQWCAHAGGVINNYSIGVEMCEPASMSYSGGASLKWFDVEKCFPVIERTYRNAVLLFAYLCESFAVPTDKIYGHGELRPLGLSTSTHVDPVHLWDQLSIGYTMDGFRKDVQTLMELNYTDCVYKTLYDIPNVFRPTIEKLISQGYIQGEASGDLNLTRSMCRTLVINDRAGIYG